MLSYLAEKRGRQKFDLLGEACGAYFQRSDVSRGDGETWSYVKLDAFIQEINKALREVGFLEHRDLWLIHVASVPPFETFRLGHQVGACYKLEEEDRRQKNQKKTGKNQQPDGWFDVNERGPQPTQDPEFPGGGILEDAERLRNGHLRKETRKPSSSSKGPAQQQPVEGVGRGRAKAKGLLWSAFLSTHGPGLLQEELRDCRGVEWLENEETVKTLGRRKPIDLGDRTFETTLWGLRRW